MKRRWMTLSVCFFVFLFLIAISINQAWTADPLGSIKGVKTGVAPLKDPIRVTAMPVQNIVPAPDDLDQAYRDFRQQYNEYIAAVKRYDAIEKPCLDRTYSVADQQRAGCLATDTVADCNSKLLISCTGEAGQAARIKRNLAHRRLGQLSRHLKHQVDQYAAAVPETP